MKKIVSHPLSKLAREHKEKSWFYFSVRLREKIKPMLKLRELCGLCENYSLLRLMLVLFLGMLTSAQAAELYYTNRTFTAITFNLQGIPTMTLLDTETAKLTNIVQGYAIQLNSNDTYAIEQNAIALGYTSATAAWNAAVNYSGSPSNHLGEIFDNVGWVRGTKLAHNEWGAYLWTLQNRISFKSSATNMWVSSNGVPVAITNVMVGSLGDYQAMADVVDIGPHLDAATNFMGAGQSTSATYYADITNVYYQLVVPSIWITPRIVVTNAGGDSVQYSVTGTNIPQGVSWTNIPDLGSNGASIASSSASNAYVLPGNLATNYKIRATSKDNTNFYDQVDLMVRKVHIVETNVYIGILSTNTLHLTADSSANVQWQITPLVQTGASIQGSSIGTSVVINAGSIPTNYTVKANAIDVTNCCDTCTVTAVKVEVTNIKFNWDTGSSLNDAINIRPDYSTNYDISNGEWIKDITNLPVCYTINESVMIKARFTVQPTNVTNADIWAAAMDTEGSLGDVLETNVTFSGGVSSPEYVTLQIFNTTPSCIQKTSCDVWQWKMENVNGSGSIACNINSSGVHTVYTILAAPVSPWDNAWAGGNNPSNAWTKALDFVIGNAACNGDSTAANALVHIAQYLHTGHGLTYDVSNGAPAYASSPLGGTLNLTEYIDKTGGYKASPPRPGNVVNCYDQAGGVCTLGCLLGVSVAYRYMAPFGYINTINLVGVGNCNNPFYPLSTSGLKIAGTDDVEWVRTKFDNHAFTTYGGYVFDACAGPSIGTQTEAQYVSDTIDTSTPAEAAFAGSTSNICSGAVTDIE